MERDEVRLELLIGRQVHAPDGRRVGRVEEVLATPEDGWVVREYHVGGAALLERVAAPLTGGPRPRGLRVPWDKLDLSDPQRPRLTCPPEELERI